MPSLKCVDRVVEYLGASARVVVSTASESACEEVLKLRDPQEIMDLVRRHGGCRLVSEEPLKVVTADGEVELEAEPVNLLARAYFGLLIERLKRVCVA